MTTLREKLGRSDSIPCEDLEKQYALQSDPEGFFFMNKATYEWHFSRQAQPFP